MAEYYSLLARAVGRLHTNNEVSRRDIYVKARNALIQQLKAINPPLSPAEISKQRLELEEAIRKVERDVVLALQAQLSEEEISRNAERAMEEALAQDDIAPRAYVIPTPTRPAAEEPRVFPRPEPMRETIREPMREPPQRQSVQAERRMAPPPPPPVEDFEPDDQDAAFTVVTPSVSPVAPAAPPPRPAPQPSPAASMRAPQPNPAARLSRAAPSRPPPPPVAAAETNWEPPAAAMSLSDAAAADIADDPGRRTARPVTPRRVAAPARERAKKPSMLPRLIIFVVIVAVLGGVGYVAYLNWDKLEDIYASVFGGTAETTEDAATAADTVAPVVAGDVAVAEGDVRVVGPQPPDVVAQQPNALLFQPAQAILYEENATESPGLEATIVWRLIQDPSGPIISATIDIPARAMQIILSIEENHNPVLLFTHEVDILVTVPQDFPGGGIREITNLAPKTTEEAIGEPLVGVSHQLPPDFFWIELSAEAAEANVTRMRTRGWFDLGLVYANGQRAVLTFEKGSLGEIVFRDALAGWDAN